MRKQRLGRNIGSITHWIDADDAQGTSLADLSGSAAMAAEPAILVLDGAAVPYLNQQGRSNYAYFPPMDPPRAMAVASNAAVG